ncbi:hypothetical protein [Brucella lupini]|uniref:hypothetical protein n=1 Tax=Brucella lupini TaxID=255457 RepID=UPI00142D1DA9|nr:hypothetical protein [Brucella lupini]
MSFLPPLAHNFRGHQAKRFVWSGLVGAVDQVEGVVYDALADKLTIITVPEWPDLLRYPVLDQNKPNMWIVRSGGWYDGQSRGNHQCREH